MATTVSAAIEATKRNADRHAAQIASAVDALRTEGIMTYTGIARELTARGVLAPRRGQWDASAVRRLLARLSRLAS